MTDNFRDRLATAIYEAARSSGSGYIEGQEGNSTVDPTGDYGIVVDGELVFTALADAVIRELAKACESGCVWRLQNPPAHRYVTEWSNK